MNDVVIIESVTEAGTEWLVSFDGPNPDDDKCIRVANAEEAAKLKRLVDAAKVAPLAAMLDRLGGDGAYHALNGHDVKTVADSMFAFSQWLEARARCDALVDVQSPPFNLRVPFKLDIGGGMNWSEATYGGKK
jgi:hypothetical protein